MNPQERILDITEKLNEGLVKKEDLIKVFNIFLNVLKDMKSYNETNVANGLKSMQSIVDKCCSDMDDSEEDIKDTASDLKTFVSDKMKELSKMLYNEIEKVKDSIPDVADLSPLESKIEASIAYLESKIPQLPEELKAEGIRDKLETLTGDDRLDKSAIKGLDEEFKNIDKKIVASTRVIGGGKSIRGSSFSFSGNGSTTTFYLPTEVAGKGMFIFAHYQGQWLQQGVHYSLSGKTFNTLGGTNTFTPANGTTIEGFIINL